MSKDKNKEKKTRKERLKPISLYPLEAKEALSNILKIKPSKKEINKKRGHHE